MPKHRTLYMVTEEEGEPEWLTMDQDWNYHSRRPAKPEEITLEALADMLDQDAENRNAHDFVLCHRALAALLHQMVGRSQATQIFRRLAGYQGLHGMNGVCGAGFKSEKAVAKELGVPLDGWKKWKLP